MNRIARCCCGQASIEVEGDPRIHVVCHCEDCRRRTGSAFGISAYFRDTQVREKTGQVSVYEIDNEETQQLRYFCSSCGTTLYWKLLRFDRIPHAAKMTGIAGGCFIGEPLPDPAYSASTEQKCAWLELPAINIV